MTSAYKIPAHKDSPNKVWAIVEIPKDTNVKYEYDPEFDLFRYDRSLLSAMVYPASYGFIPNTLAEDSDALDILIYNAMPIQTGTIVECRVLGVLDMIDDSFRDYKILGVPVSHIRDYRDLSAIDPAFLSVCKNFFSHYKDLINKEVDVLSWHGAGKAKEIILESYL
jgi:inorganic pyrophosphatase